MYYDQKISKGLDLLSKGKIQEADEIFCDILTKEPNFADALYGRACVARALGNHASAIGLAGQAIESKSRSYYYIPLGLSLYEQGHTAEGEAALKSAILLNPYDPRAYHALALIQEGMKNKQEAEIAFREAIELQPSSLTYWQELVRFYYQDEEFEQALNIAKDAVKNNAGKIEFLHELGVLLYKMSILDEAERVFRKIIRFNSNIISAYANLGAVLFQLNRLKEAKVNLLYAVEHAPEIIETQVNLGLVQMGLGDLLEAKQLLQDAYQKAPTDPRIGLNLGTVLFELGALEEAERIYRELLEPAASISITAEEYHKLQYNLSMVLLARGEFVEGWQHMEARHYLLNHFPDRDDIPVWDGQAPVRTLLVRAEQGLGDTIQFIRYLPVLLQQYSVVIEVPKGLVNLMEVVVRSYDVSHRCVVIEKDAVLPKSITHQITLMSVPYLLQLQEISQYQLNSNIPQNESCLVPSDHLKVGLCWAGNRDNRFDLLRSISPLKLMTLFEIPNVDFYALQTEIKKTELPQGFSGILPRGDMLETVLYIQHLDLVITVDTVIAHLAGMLGKPVWLLNRYGGDWRWYPAHQDEKKHSLWYPTIRIFKEKQPLPPDQAWSELIVKVKAELMKITKKLNA